jgi:dolichol-phosphate mannosyltransferase
VVVPLYNEEENVNALWERLRAVLEPIGSLFEVVLVDDGSRDATPRLIDALHNRDSRVVVTRLSRNFGHQAAICAGLEQARGQAVLVMDGDLQDPPELIPQFIRLWREGNDVVYAVRRHRREGLIKQLAYATFYRLLGLISNLDIPLDSGDFCLMDRRVVDTFNGLPERCRFVRGLRSFLGFRQAGLVYDRPAREMGRPKYTLRQLFGLAIDGLISFSSSPLRTVTYLGIGAAGLALMMTGWVLNDAIRHQTAPRGWASTMVVVLFMGAVQLLSLGVIGEYIRLIFVEAKGRPTYIVDEVRRHPGTTDWSEDAPDECSSLTEVEGRGHRRLVDRSRR